MGAKKAHGLQPVGVTCNQLVAVDLAASQTMDLRLAWRPREHLELAIVGQNLLAAYHWEYGSSMP